MDPASRLLAGLLLFALAVVPWARGQEIALTSDQVKALGITTSPPLPQATGEVHGLAAEVMVPNNQLHVVSTPLPGLIESVLVAVNERVQRGQPLARMQSTALAEAQRSFLQAGTQTELARANLDRDQKLAADGLIAESRLMSTQAMHVQAVALLAERRNALKLAGMSDAAIAALQSGTAISTTITMTAPVDGVVIEQMAQAGQRLEAFTPIYRIARLDPLWLEIQVPLARAAGIREGAPVQVPSADAKGRIISVGRRVTPESQTVMLRALISVNAARLRPGQYVEVTVATAAGGTPQWRVPNAALVRHQGKPLLFVRTGQGFRAVPVALVNEGPQATLVTGDLAGAEIAVSGIPALKARLLGMGG
ncbi:MAG: efflux RND transporter periplasmic adaptor subunit [Burkholderiales bacterium]|nr:efflux RND transporter periplasmic adaptor subunit [Burkholderiales bacterium]